MHSGGIEEAVTSGLVTDLVTLEAFLTRRIRSHGLVTASIAAAVHRGELMPADADHETDARTPAPAAREASRSQGRGWLGWPGPCGPKPAGTISACGRIWRWPRDA
ncbi:putative urease accessory protein UreF [Mycobacterium kansasii 824]|uniref:Putative urease accessory protein UreF n=1 Tax=Mycobacterium kansasii TaxID=1768 RepID=A0A1V3XE06_MYCKA|nr:putative urease accessory protein UreF [Mycobacterium kansasii 824]OOK77449.1 putative urease accessory protein UreF [Mycobacterium kansasii]